MYVSFKSFIRFKKTRISHLINLTFLTSTERDWLEMKHHNDKLLEHDLTHVLNQLPIDELEDIFGNFNNHKIFILI
jgi:hypothetical protein